MLDAAPVQIQSPLHQSAEYEAALCRYGHAPVRLSNGMLALQRRLPGGLRLTMLPRAAPVALDDLRVVLKTSGLHRSLVILAPDSPTPDCTAMPLLSPSTVAELPLFGDPSQQGALLHQKWRNRLARAQGHGLSVSARNTTLDWLLDADDCQRRQRGYQGWPSELTRCYITANPDAMHLLTAFERTTPVAAALFLRHGASASYHIGHTTKRGRELSAHNLIIWRAMCHFGRLGLQTLELGPLDTEAAPGLARFKLGTGARPRVLGGTWLWLPQMGRALRPLTWLDRRLMAQHRGA